MSFRGMLGAPGRVHDQIVLAGIYLHRSLLVKPLLHEIATNGTVDPRVSLNRPLSDPPQRLRKAPLGCTLNKAHHWGTPTIVFPYYALCMANVIKRREVWYWVNFVFNRYEERFSNILVRYGCTSWIGSIHLGWPALVLTEQLLSGSFVWEVEYALKSLTTGALTTTGCLLVGGPLSSWWRSMDQDWPSLAMA